MTSPVAHLTPAALSSGSASRLWSLASALAAGILAGPVAWARRGHTYDDAMIAARYARNLIDGKGWTYNPLVEEAVNASTSPLSTVAHALAAVACGGDLESAQVVVCVLAVTVAAFCASRLVAPAGRAAALAAALLLACVPLLYATLGLESALFVATSLAACALYSGGHHKTAALAVGLAGLARPEGLLLGVLLAADTLWRRRDRGAAREVGRVLGLGVVASLPLLPWLVFAQVQFGTIVPHTLAAKLAQGRSGWWGMGDRLFLRGMKHSLEMFDARALGLGYKPVVAVCAVGIVVAALRVRSVLLPISFAVLQVLAHALLGVPYYPWYAAPVHAGAMLALVAIGVALWAAGHAGRLLAVAWFVLVGGLAFPGWWHTPGDSYSHYRAAADWLRQESAPTASIACAEVGVLGFGVEDRTIVDMCGLVTPDGVPAIAAGRLDWWLDAHRPTYVVVHDPPWPGFEARALGRSEFEAAYRRGTVIQAGEILVVYRRR